ERGRPRLLVPTASRWQRSVGARRPCNSQARTPALPTIPEMGRRRQGDRFYIGPLKVDMSKVSKDRPSPETEKPVKDLWLEKFYQHLATDRGASAYTQRNYRQALEEF